MQRQETTKNTAGPAHLAEQGSDLIRTTIYEMCRPFGGVGQWQVESANDGLFRCSVRLVDPRQHALMVKTLGGRMHGHDVQLDIRLRARQA
jgi:hypothetical protein